MTCPTSPNPGAVTAADSRPQGVSIVDSLSLNGRLSITEAVRPKNIDARFLFKVWATGQWKIGECVIVFHFSGYMLSLSFLMSALSFSNQNPCVTNPMSILYISPMTDKKTTHHILFRVLGPLPYGPKHPKTTYAYRALPIAKTFRS